MTLARLNGSNANQFADIACFSEASFNCLVDLLGAEGCVFSIFHGIPGDVLENCWVLGNLDDVNEQELKRSARQRVAKIHDANLPGVDLRYPETNELALSAGLKTEHYIFVAAGLENNKAFAMAVAVGCGQISEESAYRDANGYTELLYELLAKLRKEISFDEIRTERAKKREAA